MEQKLLSIVIPSYNMEAYLGRCVSSLLSLEPAELAKTEIIVVNDGSKDNTSGVAHSFRLQCPDVVRVIDKENGNYGSCVNCGLASAQGKYVKILDADDWFDAEAYATFVGRLQALDVDLVVTDFNQVDADGHVSNASHFCGKYEGVMATLKQEMGYWPMHSLCYRTEMLREHRYEQTTGISYTDTEWAIIPLLYVKQFSFVPVTLYQYFVGRDGQTMDAAVLFNRRTHLIKTLTKCIDWINRERQNGPVSPYVEGRLNLTISFLYFTLLVDNRGKACPELVEFDKYLERNAGFAYRKLDKDVLGDASQFHFIRAWRNSHYVMPEMSLICRFRVFVHKCRIHARWLWETKVRHKSQNEIDT